MLLEIKGAVEKSLDIHCLSWCYFSALDTLIKLQGLLSFSQFALLTWYQDPCWTKLVGRWKLLSASVSQKTDRTTTRQKTRIFHIAQHQFFDVRKSQLTIFFACIKVYMKDTLEKLKNLSFKNENRKSRMHGKADRTKHYLSGKSTCI